MEGRDSGRRVLDETVVLIDVCNRVVQHSSSTSAFWRLAVVVVCFPSSCASWAEVQSRRITWTRFSPSLM